MSEVKADASTDDMFVMVKRAIELAAMVGPAMITLHNAADSNLMGEQLMLLEDDQDSSSSAQDMELQLDSDFIAATIEGLDLCEVKESDCNPGASAVVEGSSSVVKDDTMQPFEINAYEMALNFKVKDDATTSDPPFESGGETMESVIDLMVELAEVLVSLKQAFLKSSRAEQEALADQIASFPGALEELYSLMFDIFECECVYVQ